MKSHSILKLIFTTSILLMVNINHGVENDVVVVVCITMWLLSARRQWKQEEDET